LKIKAVSAEEERKEIMSSLLINRTVTDAMAAANRENGRKAKGAVTEQGKAMSRANAGKHWGRAEDVRGLMPALEESPAEYDRMRDSLYRALRPSDAFEEMLVDDMADLHWRLRRMVRGEAAARGQRRRERKMREEEIEAVFDSGKFHELMPWIIPKLGFVGLGDSPVKFQRILEMLRLVAQLVHYGGFQPEVVKYLKQLYGPYPSGRGSKLMGIYDRCYKESETADAAQNAANQAAFQEALADEIGWFEQREANHLQARAELRAPTVEAELVSSALDLGQSLLYQDRLERAFERKWKLLVNYRMMRAPEDDSNTDRTIEVKAQNEEASSEDNRPLGEPAAPESNVDGQGAPSVDS
jgi:hypothetical protein